MRGAKKRAGLLIGGAIFLAATLLCNRLVFKIDVTGADVYRREILGVLEENGVKAFSPYPSDRENKIRSAILSFADVSFCSVEKSGMTVRVEVRLSAFSAPSPATGDMLSAHSGVIVHLAVLRGTPLKKAGDEVRAGEPLAGAYILRADGEKEAVTVIARARIACLFDEVIAAGSPEEAFAAAYLLIDGEISERNCLPEAGGYRVKIAHTVTETLNF